MWKLLLSLGKFHSCNMDCMYRVYNLTRKCLLVLKISQCVLNEKHLDLAPFLHWDLPLTVAGLGP